MTCRNYQHWFYVSIVLLKFVNSSKLRGELDQHGRNFIVASFCPLQGREYNQIILEYNSSVFINASIIARDNTSLPFVVAPGHSVNPTSCGKVCILYARRYTNNVVLVNASEIVAVLGSLCLKPCKSFQVYPINKLLRDYAIAQESNFTSCSIVSTRSNVTVKLQLQNGTITDLNLTSDIHGTFSLPSSNNVVLTLDRLEVIFISKSNEMLPDIKLSSTLPVAVFCGARDRNNSDSVLSIQQLYNKKSNSTLTTSYNTYTTIDVRNSTSSSLASSTLSTLSTSDPLQFPSPKAIPSLVNSKTTTSSSSCLCVTPAKEKSNKSEEQLEKELKEFIQNIKTTLAVKKTELSSHWRRKRSAHDNRPSSQGLGYFGAVIIISVIVFIIMGDFPVLVHHISIMKQRIKNLTCWKC